MKTGMPILYENPREGRRPTASSTPWRPTPGFPQGRVVVDFGTATTFDRWSPIGGNTPVGSSPRPGHPRRMRCSVDGEAAPGGSSSAPRPAIGRNTVNSIQAGLVFGYAGLVDALV
jgi:type III pantothenate kinase